MDRFSGGTSGFFSPTAKDWLSGPPSLLPNACRRLFTCRYNGRDVRLTSLPALRCRNERSSNSTALMSFMERTNPLPFAPQTSCISQFHVTLIPCIFLYSIHYPTNALRKLQWNTIHVKCQTLHVSAPECHLLCSCAVVQQHADRYNCETSCVALPNRVVSKIARVAVIFQRHIKRSDQQPPQLC